MEPPGLRPASMAKQGRRPPTSRGVGQRLLRNGEPACCFTRAFAGQGRCAAPAVRSGRHRSARHAHALAVRRRAGVGKLPLRVYYSQVGLGYSYQWRAGCMRTNDLILDDEHHLWHWPFFSLAESLRSVQAGERLARFVVVNLGFVHFQFHPSGLIINLRPELVLARTIASAICFLSDLPSRRTVLACLETSWEHRVCRGRAEAVAGPGDGRRVVRSGARTTTTRRAPSTPPRHRPAGARASIATWTKRTTRRPPEWTATSISRSSARTL